MVNYRDNNFYVTYSNVDASKTTATKLALNNALLVNSNQQMKQQLQKLQSALGMPKRAVTKAKIYNNYVYGNSKTNFFDKIVPILMGFFVFFFVFLI